VVNALDDYEWRQRKAVAAYALNRSRPFPIARLKLLASATSISTGNDHATTNNAYHEACLVKVVEVAVLDAVLRTHIGHQPEPRVYLVRVFAEGPLEVVGTQQTRLKLRAALYKSVYPQLANRLLTTHHEEGIHHIFHTTDPGRESSRI